MLGGQERQTGVCGDDADDGSVRYAPHTSKGFMAPPRKNLMLVRNGLMAKVGHWQAGRSGPAARLRAPADEGRRDTPS